jgi:hypothetical protein
MGTPWSISPGKSCKNATMLPSTWRSMKSGDAPVAGCRCSEGYDDGLMGTPFYQTSSTSMAIFEDEPPFPIRPFFQML